MNKNRTSSHIFESKLYSGQATKILEETGLIQILKKYGEVKIVGSYSAGLMMNGDIDIEVVGGPYSQSFIMKVLADLSDIEYFDKFIFIDIRSVEQYDGNLPIGYYIGPRKKINGEGWSIDVWFFTKEESDKYRERGTLLISEEKVTEEQRSLILEAKKWTKDKGLPHVSKKIYELILWKKIVSIEEIKKHLKMLI